MNITTFCMLFAMVASSTFLILSRRYTDLLIGVALLSNGINILIMEMGQGEGADPLPQALILTAIVIGFALVAFLSSYILSQLFHLKSDRIPVISEEEE